MSKISNILNMVHLLEDRKVHSIKDLASKLEVSERMIRTYKSELEQAGIYIISKKGLYGGYVLDDNLNHIDIGLTSSDITILESLNTYIADNSNSEHTIDYSTVIHKICNAYIKNLNNSDNLKLQNLNSNQKELCTIYTELRKAINAKNKVYIEFISVNSGYTKRIIHPAELFYYNNSWYIVAFCEKRNEIRLFKLKDIMNYKILNEKYCDFKVIK